jgi:hypothetical protein
MTQTGNTQARCALIGGAWAYRYPAKVSRHLQLRFEKLPPAIQAISWKAQVRLCKRYRQLTAKGKNVTQVVVAIARKLSAFMWAIAKQGPVTPWTAQQPLVKATAVQIPNIHQQKRHPPVWCHPRRREEADRDSRPRMRQAPDGCKKVVPTDSSVINRRVLLAPALPIGKREKTMMRT